MQSVRASKNRDAETKTETERKRERVRKTQREKAAHKLISVFISILVFG